MIIGRYVNRSRCLCRRSGLRHSWSRQFEENAREHDASPDKLACAGRDFGGPGQKHAKVVAGPTDKPCELNPRRKIPCPSFGLRFICGAPGWVAGAHPIDTGARFAPLHGVWRIGARRTTKAKSDPERGQHLMAISLQSGQQARRGAGRMAADVLKATSRLSWTGGWCVAALFMVTAPLLTVGVAVPLPKPAAPARGQDREPLSVSTPMTAKSIML